MGEKEELQTQLYINGELVPEPVEFSKAHEIAGESELGAGLFDRITEETNITIEGFDPELSVMLEEMTGAKEAREVLEWLRYYMMQPENNRRVASIIQQYGMVKDGVAAIKLSKLMEELARKEGVCHFS